MYSERNSGKSCTVVIIVVAVLAFVCIGVWWMESRFGPIFAMAVVGSLLGAILVVVGNMLGLANSRSTLDAAARFNEAMAQTERHRQLTYREQARGDVALQKAHAQLTVLDAKRINGLAQQRARLLIDLERQRLEQSQVLQKAHWTVEDSDNEQFQTWE